MCPYYSPYTIHPKLEETVVPKEILDLASLTTSRSEAVNSLIDIDEEVVKTMLAQVCSDALPEKRYWTFNKAQHMHEDDPDIFLECLV